jgi:hypothetical protein
MRKLIGKNSIFLVGRIEEIRLQLLLFKDSSMTLAEYIELQASAYKNSLN